MPYRYESAASIEMFGWESVRPSCWCRPDMMPPLGGLVYLMFRLTLVDQW